MCRILLDNTSNKCYHNILMKGIFSIRRLNLKETYNTPVVDIVFLNDVDVITYSKDNPASDASTPLND